MRVLQLIASMAGGGAERQLTYLCAGLADRGVDVHVGLLHRSGPNMNALERDGITIHHLESRHHNPLLLPRLVKLIGRVGPDIVHTWLPLMDVFGGSAALLRRRPWILGERSSSARYPPTFKNHLRRWLGGHASVVVANSEGGRRYWSEQASPQVRAVIRNGLPIAQIDRTRPAEIATGDQEATTPLVVFAARLEQTKNAMGLVDAIAQPELRERVQVMIFGEGSQREDLQSRVANLKLQDRIRIAGYTSELWGWMKRADVFVSVSFVEGMPNTVMEAMACGCPVVVSDIPEHTEIFGGDLVVKVDPSSPASIAEGIARTLDEPEATEERAERARQRSHTWSVDFMVEAVLALYAETLSSGPSGQCR